MSVGVFIFFLLLNIALVIFGIFELYRTVRELKQDDNERKK